MSEPEITDCACGNDHETMPMIDVSIGDEGPIYVEGVCRIHKRHIPCRKCDRMNLVEYVQSVGIELLPWQRTAAEAIERGERFYIAPAKQLGRTFFFDLVEEWQEHRKAA